jgi:hypothetical protein
MPQDRDRTKERRPEPEEDISVKTWAESASKSPDDFPEEERTAADSREPMTIEQAERLRILAKAAREPFDPSLGRREADRRIAELERQAAGSPGI